MTQSLTSAAEFKIFDSVCAGKLSWSHSLPYIPQTGEVKRRIKFVDVEILMGREALGKRRKKL